MQQTISPARVLVISAALVIVVAGMRQASTIVVPFLLATFFAVVLTPALRWLQKRGLPTPISLLIIISIVIFGAYGVVSLVGHSLGEFYDNLPQYQRRLEVQVTQFEDQLQEWGIAIPSWDERERSSEQQPSGSTADVSATGRKMSSGKSRPSFVPQNARDLGRSSLFEVDQYGSSQSKPFGQMEQRPSNGNEAFKPRLMPSIDARYLLQLVTSMLGSLGGIFSNAFVILITVLFMLLETSRFPAKIQAVFGSSTPRIEHTRMIIDNMRRYMAIKTATSLLTGVLVTTFLSLLGISYPLLWGLLAFLFNYVPNIGSILAAVPPVVLAVVESESGLGPAAITATGFVAINCLISVAIEPRYMGQGLGLSTLVVFLSLVFWGWVLGPAGMLLSAPLTMIIKIVLADYEDTRWIAVLMSTHAPSQK